MVKSVNLLRPKFTTHADGSDAVLVMHELIGEEDGPTIGISASIHGNENTGSQAILDLFRQLQDDAPQGTHPAPAGRQCPGLRGQPALHAPRRAQPEPRISRQPARQLHPAARQGRSPTTSSSRIDIHLDLHSGTDRPTVDYVYIWNDEALSRAFGSKVLYRPVEGKEGTVYCRHHQVGDPRRAGHPCRGGGARRRHRRPDALRGAHGRRPR